MVTSFQASRIQFRVLCPLLSEPLGRGCASSLRSRSPAICGCELCCDPPCEGPRACRVQPVLRCLPGALWESDRKLGDSGSVWPSCLSCRGNLPLGPWAGESSCRPAPAASASSHRLEPGFFQTGCFSACEAVLTCAYTAFEKVTFIFEMCTL